MWLIAARTDELGGDNLVEIGVGAVEIEDQVAGFLAEAGDSAAPAAGPVGVVAGADAIEIGGSVPYA